MTPTPEQIAATIQEYRFYRAAHIEMRWAQLVAGDLPCPQPPGDPYADVATRLWKVTMARFIAARTAQRGLTLSEEETVLFGGDWAWSLADRLRKKA